MIYKRIEVYKSNGGLTSVININTRMFPFIAMNSRWNMPTWNFARSAFPPTYGLPSAFSSNQQKGPWLLIKTLIL